MSKKKKQKTAFDGRADRIKLSAKETLKRMEEFSKRKDAFIAAIRKGKDRGVST